MLNVAIVGVTGYTGEEILKLLLNHKNVKVTHLTSKIDKSEKINDLFLWLRKKVDLVCEDSVNIDDISKKASLVFLALPHKISMEFAPKFLSNGLKVIDLSADYRLPADIYKVWYGVGHRDEANIKNAVYGLPEINRKNIKSASLIANPGCYPTGSILASAPLVKEKVVELDNIIIDSKSGTTGAGRKPDVALSFAEVDENFKAYKINQHQHMPEIKDQLSILADVDVNITFVPHLVPMRRGILSTVYFEAKNNTDDKSVLGLYRKFYKGEPFVRVLDEGKFPQISDVVGTNFCDIGIKVQDKRIVVVSCIDNLTKGAAGQAVQNMNIISGLEETEALLW